MPDVVVIGGGILGATAALHLPEAGADVVLVEREPALGTQTTAAGAGFVGYWAGELEAELAGYGMHGYVVLAGCNECCLTHGPGLAGVAATPFGIELP